MNKKHYIIKNKITYRRQYKKWYGLLYCQELKYSRIEKSIYKRFIYKRLNKIAISQMKILNESDIKHLENINN